MLALLGANAELCRGQEIAPFRFTGKEGYVSLRYLSDEFATQSPSANSRQRLGDVREEVFLMTHSYVYHPSFLTLDVGAGPIFDRARLSTDSGESSLSNTLYDLSARATFLRDKPYRGSLFYEHLNPTLAIAPGSILLQESTRYGFDVSLLEPVQVSLDATRFRNHGRNADYLIHDAYDQLNLRAARDIGQLGTTQLRYQLTQQDSMSGSPNLPTQQTSLHRQYLQLDTRLHFGERQEYDLYNLVSIDKQAFGLSQGTLPERRGQVLLDLRGTHSDKLRTFATYEFNSIDQGFFSTKLNTGSAGANYSPWTDLTLRLAARASDNRTTQFDQRSQGADASIQYRRPLGASLLSGGYAVRYDQRDQKAAAPEASVIGEHITLTGTDLVPLAQSNVIAASIVVSNAGRTQTFTEGIDYAVSVVGLQTRLQRRVGGNILDGQEVLVDYRFDVGGTFALKQTNQTLSVNWSLGNYLDLYFRHFDYAVNLTSGTPTIPLNPVKSTVYGARADVPLRLPIELTLGGFYEGERRRETLAPYRRQRADAYVQTEVPFFRGGSVRVTARRVNQDFDDPSHDVRLTGYDLDVWTRHAFGIDLSATASYERDRGGLPRRRIVGTVRMQWRYRQVNLTADFTRVRETQEAFERERTLVQVLARRNF